MTQDRSAFHSSSSAEPHVPCSAKFNSHYAERSEERGNPERRAKSCRFKIHCRRNQHSCHNNQEDDCDCDLEEPMHRSNYTPPPIRSPAADFRAAENLDNLQVFFSRSDREEIRCIFESAGCPPHAVMVSQSSCPHRRCTGWRSRRPHRSVPSAWCE